MSPEKVSSQPISHLHSQEEPTAPSSAYQPPTADNLQLEHNQPSLNTDKYVNHHTSTLGKVSKFFEDHPDVVVGLKVLGVALVVGGLIAASVFSFGAAVPLIAALGAGSSTASVMGAFALLGTGLGLALSSVWTVVAAKITNMHEATSKNLADFATFLALSLGGSALITGICAASGANLGLKGVIAAKVGLSTLGTALVFGTGAALVRSKLQ